MEEGTEQKGTGREGSGEVRREERWGYFFLLEREENSTHIGPGLRRNQWAFKWSFTKTDVCVLSGLSASGKEGVEIAGDQDVLHFLAARRKFHGH